VTAAFLEAIRGPHTAYGYVEARRAGARLSYTTSAGETATRLPLLDGSVPVDGGTPGTRRNLTASLSRAWTPTGSSGRWTPGTPG
jgi:hypothetical protein